MSKGVINAAVPFLLVEEMAEHDSSYSALSIIKGRTQKASLLVQIID